MWKVFGCGLFLGSNCGFIGSNWMPFGENTNPGVTMVQRMLTDWVTLTSGLSTLMPPGALQFSTVTLISQLPGEHGAAPIPGGDPLGRAAWPYAQDNANDRAVRQAAWATA